MSANQPGKGHDWIRANLGRYVNKQMSGEEEKALVEHLTGCGSCQQELAKIATGGERETPGPVAFTASQSPAGGPGDVQGERGYDIVGEEAIQELADFKGDNAPVLSLYVDMSAQERPGFAAHEHVKTLLEARSREIGQRSREEQRAFDAQSERILDWFSYDYNRAGKGLALFTCANPDLFRAYKLPVGWGNQLHVSDRPFIGPLLTIADEYEKYLIILVDKKTARLFVTHMDEIQEYSELTDEVEPHPKAGGQHAEINQRHSDMHVLWHVKRAVEAGQELWARWECDWLLIGGTEEALADLRDQLPKAMGERLAGELSVSLKARPAEVLEQAARFMRENERKQEAEQVEALLTKALGKGPGVVGLDQTLETIVTGNILVLVVDEGLHHPGFECPNCHFLGSAQRDNCPLCGTALEQQPDIVERALGRALENGALVQMLRSEDARQQLARHGGIGALLRYSITSVNQPTGG